MASKQNDFIKKMRQEYPQYGDVDDATLAKAYQQKHYSDLDENVFMDKVGLHQDTFTEKASKAIRETLEPILPSSTPPSAAQQHKNDIPPTTPIIQKSVLDDVGEFFSSTPPSAAEQHRAKPEQMDYVNPEAEDWELGKRLVNRTNELTANAIQGTYSFLGNIKSPLNYLGLETQAEQDMNKRRADWFDGAADKLSDFVYENNKLDVKPTHTWDEVKKGFNVGGVFDKDAWQELGNYVLGEGVASIPDMAEMVATLPMYYASRQQESAEKRAANQGREKPTAEDYALSAPTTIGSIMLDRFGLKGMTEDVVESVGKQALDGTLKEVTATIAKEIKNGAIKEGSTEAVQNPLEMFGEEVGTKKGLSTPADYLDTALAGAVAGGGMGAGLSGTVATGTEIFNSYTQDKRDAQREAFIQNQYNRTVGAVDGEHYQQATLDQFTQELDTKIKTIQDQFTNLVINHPAHPIPIEAVGNIDIAEQVVKDAIDNGMNVTDNDGMNAIDKGFKELEAQIGTIEPIANMVQEPIEQTPPIIEKPIIGQPEPEAVVQDSLTTVATDTDVGHKRLKELEAIPDDELTVEQQWELEDLRKPTEENFTGENVGTVVKDNLTSDLNDMNVADIGSNDVSVATKENINTDNTNPLLIEQNDYEVKPITRDATIKYIMKIAKDKGAKGTDIKKQATDFLNTINFDKITGLATGYKVPNNTDVTDMNVGDIAQNQKNSDTINQEEVSTFNKAQIKRAMKEYPNAGLNENDSVQVAQDKIKKAVENNQGIDNGRQTNSTQRDTQQSVPTSPNGASDGQPTTLQPSVVAGDDRQTGGADSTSVPSTASELSNTDDGTNGEQRVSSPRSERNSSAGVHSPVSLEDDNFTIEDDLSEGGLKTKFKNNIEAIKIVKQIQDQGYKPTPADKKTLSKYIGWGGLPAAFERPDGSVAKGWEKEAQELKAILSPEAYAEARRSTQDAHYTSKEIVDAIWSGVKQLGFKGGKVLEPSVGVGNFFGMMPSSYKPMTKLYGVELDSTTATIAKALYPKATIQNKGFQDVELSNGTFSLVIGNPPFGGQKLFDPKSKHLNDFSIHNYFFAKSMDALEEGGVLAMVVSNGLLDAANASAREYLGAQANLIGAIRLPNNAFSKNANTEVTTDIIFLQKRYKDQASNLDQWSDIGSLNDTPINQYFINNPSNLLGKWGKYGTMYRGDMPALIPFDGIDGSPAFLLPKAIAALPKNIVTHEPVIQSDESTAKFDGDVSKVRVGALFIKDGVIYKREADKDGEVQVEEIDKKLNSKNEEVFYTAKEIEKIKAMIYVVSVADELRRLQIDSASTDGQIKKARQELNRVYDAFTKQHGYLNNAANVKLFEEDIRSPFLRALEKNYDKGVSAAVAKSTKQLPKKEIAEKSDIFYKRTQTPYERPTTADNTQDALMISLGEYGAVNFSYMESLTGKSEAEIIAELDGFIYEDVNDGWVTREEFLSGNVKQKYKEATNEEYKKALLAVFPKEIDAVDISVTLGASWIPKSDMEEFITYISGDTKPSANYAAYNAKWVIRANTTSANTSKWGTNRKSVKDILEATMNLTQIEVKDNIGTSAAPQMVLNSEETAAAQDKQEQLKEEFKEWIWKSSERRERLGALYNEKFNNKVTRTFDGSHLKFIGKSDAIDLRAHQANAVWRTMQGGTVLFDHTVGTGKTYTAIASVMELRRIKKSTKPLIVVPNHLTGQWGKEWMELYPNASILVPTERDFEASRRKILMGKIATGDYDGIIIGHSQLSLIENDTSFVANWMVDEIQRIQRSIDMLRAEEGKDSRSVKNAEKSMEILNTRMETIYDMRRDDNIDFAQLGIDGLFVDESHEFKNLMYTTGLQGVAGLGNPTGSKKAFDLFIKTQGLLEKTGGNNVVFMTGTPISNTIAEMVTVQRYLSYDKLKADNLDIFDAWVKQYAEIKSDWELTPSGKYKLRTRLSRFNNMPELITEYKQFADVVTREDIPSLPIPRVKGGKPQNLVVERSPAQADYIGIEDENGKYPEKSLVYRSENLPKGKAKKGDDNMLKIMGEARKVALDMRLIDPNASDNPDSKVNVTVKNTVEIYNRWNDKRGTQLIFCDLSTPKGAVAKEKARIEELMHKADSGDEKAIQELDEMNPDDLDALNAPFSVYDDIKAKLIAQGIPEREIAFIHDAATKLQKQELFSKVKGGAIRILIGSTSKMGAGMNVQDRLVALHHIDVPWRPSDLEQREGRIIRQGNLFYQQDPKGFEVNIFRYATKNTLDSMMWQTIEAKANFIEQLRAGNLVDREVDDVSGEAMSAAEMKAMSSGNPLILEDMKLSKDIKKLEALKKNHDRNQFDLEKKIKRAEDAIAQSSAVLDAYTSDEVSAQKLPEKFSMRINGKTFDKREDAGAEILSVLDGMAKKEVKEIGSVGGFKIHIEQSGTDLSGAYATITISGKQDYDFDFTIAGHSHEGLAQKIMNIIKRIPAERANYERGLNYDKDQLPQFKEQIEPFKKADELDALRSRKKEIISQLHKKEDDKKQASDEVSGKAPISHSMKLAAKKSSMTYDEMVKQLEDNRATYEEIPYERAEWDRLFPNNQIDTVIGTVKMGDNQFEKLDPNTKDPKNHARKKQDRRKHIFYIHETLKNPSLIIFDPETKRTKLIKEFNKYDEKGHSTRIYSSIVVLIDNMLVDVSSHNMSHAQVYKEIKKGELITEAEVTPSKVTNPNPTSAFVVDDSITQITPNTQTKEDNIKEHFSRANGYDEAGINYVPPYKVIGLPERSESGEIKIGTDIVTLPSVEKPMNADTIRVYLSDIIGNRLYDAKLKGKSNLGIYKESDSSIRVKNYSDIETMAHEMAHFLDFYFKNPKREATGSFFRKEILKNKEEVKTLSYTTNPKQVLSEGFAEFVRLYLTNYNAVAGLAPNMLKDFEARLSQDKVLSKKMVQLRDGMHQYYYQGATTQNYQGGELNSIAKKIKRSQAQIGKDARQKVIDRIHSIKRIEADIKGDVDNDAMRSPYKALQLVNGHSSIMYSAMNFGVPTVLENGDISYSGKSLNDIFEPATKHGERRIQLLSNYLVARRANELKTQGRENLIPQEAIDNDLKLAEQYPEFAIIAQEYQAFNTAMLDFYVNMNHITASQRESFLEFNKNYVPFHRVIESVQNGGVSAGTIGKRLTGGTHSLGNIMENIIDGLESNIKEAMISRGKSMFYSMLEQSGMGGVYATRVATENKMVQVDLEAQAKKIAEIMAQLGLTISKDGMIVSGSMSAEEIYDIKEIEDNLLLNPEAMEFFTHGHPPTSKEGYIDSAIINGKRVYFETKDAGLVDAMTSFKGQNYGVIMSTLMAVKNIMTWNITNNPLFYLTNFARDTVSAGVLSKNGFIPVMNSVKGMYHFITQSKVYKDFMASGGGYGTMRSGLGGDVHAMEMLKVNRGFDVFNKVINAMAYGADVFEYGTRLGEFELAQKAGKSNWQAAFEGREVSTDFAIKGSNSDITGFMATVPFMKAAINGIDKTARRIFSLNGEMKLSNIGKFRNAHGEMIGHKIKFYAAGGMIVAGTLALFLQNKDDERYRRLTRDQKLMYWNIFVGDNHIKIPRPYDIGFIFSALPEIVADLIYTKHGEDALKDFMLGMKSMFSIGDISGLFQPIMDHMTNTNWMGSPIIPTQVQNVDDKADQYNDNTALLYKKVGKATGVSPILMQHYVDGYLGLTAKMIEETAENMLWDKQQWGERPFAQNPIEFLTYRFRGKEEESRTAWSEKYYDLSKRASAVKASYDAKYKKAYLDGGADITEYMSEIDKQTYIGVEDAVSNINSDLGDMKNDLEAVIYSKEYTAKQKEEIINGAYKAKRETLQAVVTQLETQLDKIEEK